MTSRCGALSLGVAACLMGDAAPAREITSPANSTIPSHVLLVGRSGTQADTAFGSFTIVAWDLSNNPDPGKLIEFRLHNCSGARVASDGNGGIGINDLALWLQDFGLAESISRSDFDGDDTVDVDDLSLWMEAWAQAGSVEGASAYCP